jgi:hypothetical protein
MCQESIIISTSIHEVKASGIARVPLFFMLWISLCPNLMN